MFTQALQPRDLVFQSSMEVVFLGVPVWCVDGREFEISSAHGEKPCATIILTGQAHLQDLRLRTSHLTQHGNSPTFLEFPVARIEHRFIARLAESFLRELVRCGERLLESDNVRFSFAEPMAKIF